MSREQKFRAWNGDRYIKLNNLRGGKTIYFSPYDLGAIPPEARGNVILEQCVGLKDLNDKEICAGDIVFFTIPHLDPETLGMDGEEERYGQVKYVVNGFYIIDKDGVDYGIYEDCGLAGHSNCEVIGNIHENPELLEGEE